MLKNYIKIAWRNLWKNKMTTSLSLFGLILGVACFMLLSTYILNELRYDRFHEKADRIAYVNLNYKSPSDAEAVHTPRTPTAVVPVAKREFAEVEDAARIYRYNSREIKVDNKNFIEKNMVLADGSLFNIFSFHFIAGNPASALQRPNTMVVTQATAQKYFGKEPALGKSILVNDNAWQITGVIEDIPSYSTLQFDIAGSYNSSERSKTEAWGSANDISVLLLKSSDQIISVQQKFNTYIKDLFKADFEAGYTMWLDLEPLAQVHLSSTASGNLLTYLYILGAIALLLLVIACINFTNLMTAKSSERLREIGVRKVLGASIPQLTALLSIDFLKLVLIAILIAAPLAWYATSEWLQDFAYKINMPYGLYALAGIAAAIALITVSFQAIKAAIANPVKSLRTE
jgi:putative ABC transport system permease protein